MAGRPDPAVLRKVYCYEQVEELFPQDSTSRCRETGLQLDVLTRLLYRPREDVWEINFRGEPLLWFLPSNVTQIKKNGSRDKIVINKLNRHTPDNITFRQSGWDRTQWQVITPFGGFRVEQDMRIPVKWI